jgi:hypothetical protein
MLTVITDLHAKLIVFFILEAMLLGYFYFLKQNCPLALKVTHSFV